MRISKKQYKLIELIEKCGYLMLGEIDKAQFPDSMVNALIEKEILFVCDGMIASSTVK